MRCALWPRPSSVTATISRPKAGLHGSSTPVFKYSNEYLTRGWRWFSLMLTSSAVLRPRGWRHTVGDRVAKDALFDAFAEVARALASGRRAEMVGVLAQGVRSVEELSEEIGQSVANTSHHLRALTRAGLLTSRREGTRIFYRLASDRVAGLWE